MNETWLIVAGGVAVRGLPVLVRDPVQRLLPAAAADPRRADPARGGVRVPRQGRRPGVAAALGHRHRVGSTLPALLWGVAFANIVRGVPMNADGNFTGTLFTLLNPYGLLGGLAVVALCCTYGAIFVALKTTGEIRHGARTLAGRIGVAAVVLGATFLVWTCWCTATPCLDPRPAHRGGAAGRAVRQPARARGVGVRAARRPMVGVVATLFAALFPDVLPSTTNPAYASRSRTPARRLTRSRSCRGSRCAPCPWCWRTRRGRTGCSANASGGATSPPHPSTAPNCYPVGSPDRDAPTRDWRVRFAGGSRALRLPLNRPDRLPSPGSCHPAQ